jgi:hypothetical protein
MYERIESHGEFTMQVAAQYAASLTFARGAVGQRYPLTTDEQKTEFAQECAEHTIALTKVNTADCGDERPIVALADGTVDPEALAQRVTRQLFGGIGLSLTKAMVEADAAAIKDAKNIWEAYLIVSGILQKLGYEDAGHYECGASASVESSVANQIDFGMVLGATGLLIPDQGRNASLLQLNTETKQRRLQAGFYSAWNPENHLDYLNTHFPQNLATLKTDSNDHETHGHNGSGLYVVTQDGVGYQRTGRAFSVTLPLMAELAHESGGSGEERERIKLGFVDDTLHVGAGIVTEGFPVFAQAA